MEVCVCACVRMHECSWLCVVIDSIRKMEVTLKVLTSLRDLLTEMLTETASLSLLGFSFSFETRQACESTERESQNYNEV